MIRLNLTGLVFVRASYCSAFQPTWSTDEFAASAKPTRAATLPEDDEFADF